MACNQQVSGGGVHEEARMGSVGSERIARRVTISTLLLMCFCCCASLCCCLRFVPLFLLLLYATRRCCRLHLRLALRSSLSSVYYIFVGTDVLLYSFAYSAADAGAVVLLSLSLWSVCSRLHLQKWSCCGSYDDRHGSHCKGKHFG
jgi:hypothetical protein